MLLTEIVSQVNIATNNQASPDLITIWLDNIQKSIFQKNQNAFLQYSQRLTVWQTINVSTFDTPFVESDIGKQFLGSDSGASGTIIAYDDTTITVVTTGTYADGEQGLVFGGTGVATLVNPTGQAVYTGPYPAPTDPPCRKIWGVTQRLPGRFWLDYALDTSTYWIDGVYNTTDYGMRVGQPSPFETGDVNDLDNTFKFSFDPSLDATYYWVYWRNPPSITDLSDSSQLIIPESQHLALVIAAIQVGNAIFSAQPLSMDQVIEQNFGGWMNSLLEPFRKQRQKQNMTQGSGGWTARNSLIS